MIVSKLFSHCLYLNKIKELLIAHFSSFSTKDMNELEPVLTLEEMIKTIKQVEKFKNQLSQIDNKRMKLLKLILDEQIATRNYQLETNA